MLTLAWLAAVLPLAGSPQARAAEAFWNVKPPSDWSVEEVRGILEHSPWATASSAKSGASLKVHLASAQPMREAEERERQARRYRVELGPSFEEYQALLDEGHSIVLAVLIPDPKALSDGVESRSLERDSVLHIGKRTYRLSSNFPPTPGDPYLRYVFPREVRAGDKSLLFEIYVPGVNYPERHVEFDLKDMMYGGKLAY